MDKWSYYIWIPSLSITEARQGFKNTHVFVLNASDPTTSQRSKQFLVYGAQISHSERPATSTRYGCLYCGHKNRLTEDKGGKKPNKAERSEHLTFLSTVGKGPRRKALLRTFHRQVLQEDPSPVSPWISSSLVCGCAACSGSPSLQLSFSYPPKHITAGKPKDLLTGNGIALQDQVSSACAGEGLFMFCNIL